MTIALTSEQFQKFVQNMLGLAGCLTLTSLHNCLLFMLQCTDAGCVLHGMLMVIVVHTNNVHNGIIIGLWQ